MYLLSFIKKKLTRKLIYKLDYTGERVVPTEMHGDINTWTQHLRRYIFALHYVVKKDVIDIACGTGYGVSILSSVSNSVVGIDKNKDTIRWARRFNTYYCPIEFIINDIEKINRIKRFDTVVSFETIEHLVNPSRFLILVRQILTKNGTFVFSVPLNDPRNKYHKHRFNWESIRNLITLNMSNKAIWYSQIENNIVKGVHTKAKFAIGVWHK